MPGTSVQISMALRAELRAEIRGRGVRAAAAEQAGVAFAVARDEALRDDHGRRARRAAARAPRRARTSRWPTAPMPWRTRRGLRPSACRAHPSTSTSMPCDLRKRAPISVAISSPLAITRARVRSRQLAHQRDAVGHLPQLVEVALQLRARRPRPARWRAGGGGPRWPSSGFVGSAGAAPRPAASPACR